VNPSVRAAAARILKSMRDTYGQALTRVPAREADYAHLDLRMYGRMDRALRAQGFAPLCDYAVREINESPTSLLAPTMIRAWTASEAGMVASYYQRRVRWPRLLRQLIKGLKNGRWIDAPMMSVKAARVRHCVEFASELADGSFVNTSNAESAESIGMPAQLDRKFHPFGTPVQAVLEDHRARVAAASGRRGGARPRPVRGIEELNAQLARENAMKNAHRAAIGWVTRGELLKLSGGKSELADAIYAEIRTLLREETQAAGGPA
jgi:hypothetical protein